MLTYVVNVILSLFTRRLVTIFSQKIPPNHDRANPLT